MRRLLSYILLSSALVIGVGASVAPNIVKMNSDIAYSNGKTLTFRATRKAADSEGEYYDPNSDDNGPITAEDGTVSNPYGPIKSLAKEVTSRLNAWELSEFKVSTIGYDTISVTLKSNTKSTVEYGRLENYLTFSGGNISLAASNTSYDDYPEGASLDEMLDGQKARIEYIENGQRSSSYPVVVMPIRRSGTYREDFINLIKYCDDNTTANTAGEGEPDNSKTTTLVVWGNKTDTDYLADGTINSANENTSKRIIVQQSVANDNAVWYEANDDDPDDENQRKNPYLMIVPRSLNSADPSEPYREALYYMHMLNASKLDYNLTFLYESEAQASVENLITLDWNRAPAMSKTLISTIVCIAVVAIVMALFHRMLALSSIAVTGLSTLLTFLAFIGFGPQFNVAALLGLALVGGISLFGQIYYNAKLKDEIYKGRTLKKANQEAAKKAILPTVDASAVALILGFFTYLFGGDLASKLGIVLSFGSLIALACNLIVYRLLMWLFANDNTVQSKFDKLIGINKEKIPDMLKEEKQSYYGAFADKDFTKGKKWVGGILGAFVLAGMVTMIVFGSLKGTVYNDPTRDSKSTSLFIEARSNAFTTNDSPTNNSVIDSVDEIYYVDGSNTSGLLTNIYYGEKSFAELYSSSSDVFDSITYSNNPMKVFASEDGDADSALVYYWYFYRIDLPKYLSPEGKYSVRNISGVIEEQDSLEEAMEALASAYYPAASVDGNKTLLLSLKVESSTENGVSLGRIALAVGVGLAVASVYMMIRHRISRGLVASLLSLGVSFAAISFFVFTRIQVSSVVALGGVAVALLSMLFNLFILNKEKELYKESREKEKENLEFRNECLKTASAHASGELILFALALAYMAICFFGFGPSAYSSIYMAMIVGLALAAVVSLSLLYPTSELLAKLLSKIHFKLPKRKKKKVGQLQKRKNKSAEPEEAVFIGIND